VEKENLQCDNDKPFFSGVLTLLLNFTLRVKDVY